MQISYLIAELRQYLSDVEEPYLWEDSELLSYIKDTLKDIYQTAYFSYFESSLDTIANTSNYPIGGFPVKVWMDDSFLPFMPYEIITQLITTNVTGKPDSFSYYNGRIYLFPIPDAAYKIRMLIKPIADLLTIDSYLLFPDIELVKLGALCRAYLKQDSETFDEKGYTKLKQEYMEKLGKFKNLYIRDSNISERSFIPRGLL